MSTPFQKEFLDNKYGINEMLVAQQELDFELSVVKYYKIDDINSVTDIVFEFIEEFNIHSNDVAILGDKIDVVRQVDFKIRNTTHEDTMTTFETKEEYDDLKERNLLTQDNITKIRRAKKSGFWLNAGMLKISTVHSFKGWEIHTVFLLIDDKSTAELIYTGITRARQNIIIIDLGSLEYADFLREYCKETE